MENKCMVYFIVGLAFLAEIAHTRYIGVGETSPSDATTGGTFTKQADIESTTRRTAPTQTDVEANLLTTPTESRQTTTQKAAEGLDSNIETKNSYEMTPIESSIILGTAMLLVNPDQHVTSRMATTMRNSASTQTTSIISNMTSTESSGTDERQELITEPPVTHTESTKDENVPTVLPQTSVSNNKAVIETVAIVIDTTEALVSNNVVTSTETTSGTSSPLRNLLAISAETVKPSSKERSTTSKELDYTNTFSPEDEPAKITTSSTESTKVASSVKLQSSASLEKMSTMAASSTEQQSSTTSPSLELTSKPSATLIQPKSSTMSTMAASSTEQQSSTTSTSLELTSKPSATLIKPETSAESIAEALFKRSTRSQSSAETSFLLSQSDAYNLVENVSYLNANVVMSFKIMNGDASTTTLASYFTDAVKASRPQLPASVTEQARSCQEQKTLQKLEKARDVFYAYKPWMAGLMAYNRHMDSIDMYLDMTFDAFNTIIASSSLQRHPQQPSPAQTPADLNTVFATLSSIHNTCNQFIHFVNSAMSCQTE